MADESMFSPLGVAGKQPKATPSPDDDWEIVSPVPADAPAAPTFDSRFEMPTHVHVYRQTAGVQACMVRYDTPQGKLFVPLTFWRNTKTGECKWRKKSSPAPRPLFNMHLLERNGSSPVIIVEGEKCAEAGQNKLSDLGVWTTSPGGALAFSKADWSPLKGRQVIIWPDNDEPGERYARGVAKFALAAGAASVAIVKVPK